MKYAILIPTFGPSAKRLKPLLDSIEKYTKGFDYEIIVRDDATPEIEHVALSEAVSKEGGATFIRGTEWGRMWGNFHEIGKLGVETGADILVYINDDVIMSKGWLVPFDYFYKWNEKLKPGMVSGGMIEAWELAMNGIIGHEYNFYSHPPQDWSNDGNLLREHLEFSQELFDSCKVDGEERIHLTTYSPMGPIVDGKYNLTRAVPLVGGLGPFFTMRADVFTEVNGFEKCEFTGDYEAMIGLKVWEAGYKCCLIPSPPAYHARGVASYQAYGLFDEKTWVNFRPWTPTAMARFHEMWGFETLNDAIKDCENKYMNAASELLAKSRILKVQDQKFPINIEYDKLSDVNLGQIDWRDPKQGARMQWIAEQCTGHILDVGCASGGLQSFLKGVNLYTGVDLDRVRIEEAIRTSEGDFYVMDATYGLPFNIDSFTCSVCADLLEHVPKEDSRKLIVELIRVSKEKVILTFPQSEEFIENDDHVWDSTPDEVQKLLEGLEGVTINTDLLEDFTLVTLEVTDG